VRSKIKSITSYRRFTRGLVDSAGFPISTGFHSLLRFIAMKLFLTFVVLLICLSLIAVAAGESKSKLASQGSDDVEVKYTSKADLDSKLKEIQEKRRADLGYDDSLSESELKDFQEREKDLRLDVLRAELNHGEYSNERAKALHALGANLFRQLRFDELLEISKQIVRIHETLDGFESLMAGKALGNMGTVAYRLGDDKECELAMKRALYIMLHEGGLKEESREVLIHRGKMLSFGITDGETTKGLSYDEYVNLLEDEL
jgi:hypothetical protein